MLPISSHIWCFTLLLMCANSGSAEPFASFRGVAVNKTSDESIAHLYQEAERVFVRKFLTDLYNKDATTTTLDRFLNMNWPILADQLERSRPKIVGQFQALEQFTSLTQRRSITPEQFYDEVLSSNGRHAHFKTRAAWLGFLRSINWNSNTTVTLGIPSDGKHAYRVYERGVRFGNFADDWVLDKLKDLDPETFRSLYKESWAEEAAKPIPLDEQPEYQARNRALSEARNRIIVPLILHEIEFSKESDREAFVNQYRSIYGSKYIKE